MKEFRPGRSGGSNFYFQSKGNPNWSDGINDLKMIPASAFEAIVSP